MQDFMAGLTCTRVRNCQKFHFNISTYVGGAPQNSLQTNLFTVLYQVFSVLYLVENKIFISAGLSLNICLTDSENVIYLVGLQGKSLLVIE